MKRMVLVCSIAAATTVAIRTLPGLYNRLADARLERKLQDLKKQLLSMNDSDYMLFLARLAIMADDTSTRSACVDISPEAAAHMSKYLST